MTGLTALILMALAMPALLARLAGGYPPSPGPELAALAPLAVVPTIAAVIMDFANISPVNALYWTAVINGLLAPFLLLAVLIVACDQKIMHGQTSSTLGRVVVGITTAVMLAAAFMVLR